MRLPEKQLSWEWRQRWWHLADFASLAKRGLIGLAVALALVGTTVVLDGLLLGREIIDLNDPRYVNAQGAAITVLGTVVGFFAVATLAISVSLSLLQVAAERYVDSELMSVFVDDPDRELLLQLIYTAFLISLADLFLLTASVLHPLPALALPISLACATLMLMVGYVHSRVRLFDADGLAAHIVKRIERNRRVLWSGWSDAVYQSADRDIRRLFLLAKRLVEENREDDARRPLDSAIRNYYVICDTPGANSHAMDGLYAYSWVMALSDFEKQDGLLLGSWITSTPPPGRLVLEDEWWLTRVLTIAAARPLRTTSTFLIGNSGLIAFGFFEKCAEIAAANEKGPSLIHMGVTVEGTALAIDLAQRGIDTLGVDSQLLREVATEAFIRHLGEEAHEFRLPEEVAADPESRDEKVARCYLGP